MYIWWSCCWSHVYLCEYSTQNVLCVSVYIPRTILIYVCLTLTLVHYTHLDMLVNVGFCLSFFFSAHSWRPFGMNPCCIFLWFFPFYFVFGFYFLDFFFLFELILFSSETREKKWCVRMYGEYTINKLLLVCPTSKTTHWQYYMYKFT